MSGRDRTSTTTSRDGAGNSRSGCPLANAASVLAIAPADGSWFAHRAALERRLLQRRAPNTQRFSESAWGTGGLARTLLSPGRHTSSQARRCDTPPKQHVALPTPRRRQCARETLCSHRQPQATCVATQPHLLLLPASLRQLHLLQVRFCRPRGGCARHRGSCRSRQRCPSPPPELPARHWCTHTAANARVSA